MPSSAPTFGKKGMRPGPGRGPRKRRSGKLLVSQASAPARCEWTHNGGPRVTYGSFLAVALCVCLLAPAGAARAGSAPTPDAAPTGGTSPDPAPTGGAPAPVPVKRVAPT